MYSINFTESLHYNGANNYLFENGTEIYKLKAKDSEIAASPLCLGKISKDWPADNMKKQGLMVMSGFVKKVFFVGLTILSGFTSTNSLNAIPIELYFNEQSIV